MATRTRASGLVVAEARIEIPTGLTPGEIAGLKRGERVALAGWHDTVAGDDNGQPWLPAAIRQLPVDARLQLATDDEVFAAWIERERRRCVDVEYFIAAYGSVRDDEDTGPPVPFRLWPAQIDVLDTFIDEDRIVVLKARQLGLTWLALHFGVHLIAIDPTGRNAIVLGLSQDGGYAKRLLERARQINALLPTFLRHGEDRETQGSKTEFKLHQRGRMVSLPGTPAAPRSWQADFAICDEWAFVRNGQAGPTMRALMPAARKIVAISSGNGPAEEAGWGQHFAQLYERADAGENEWVPVFLPTSTHPARDAAWRDVEQGNYDTDEEFLAEHPETSDEALIGAGKDRYFKIAQINAAVRAGAELDALLGTDAMPPPSGDLIHLGVDWGEQGVALVVWPLEGGGVYVPPSETYAGGAEPGEQTIAIHRRAGEIQDVSPETGRPEPLIGEARYDAAGVQSMKTLLATARARFAHQYANGEVRSRKVPFGKYKTETAKYLRRLFKRVGDGRTTGVVAISPANVELIRQLRALESGPGGVWKKATDQDGPDALVAGVQRIARRHRELQGDAGGQDDDAEA